jgi:Dolichyl-phosphate-mannose-protein mannosyltransferase
MDSKRWAGAALAGIVLCVVINVAVRYQPYTFIRRDASFYATIAIGLVKDGSLDQRRLQPQSWYSGQHPGYANLDAYWSNVSVGRNGVWYPKHSVLVSIAAAPFYAAFGVDGLLLFNALCVVGMLWAVYFMAVRFAGPVGAAIAVVVTAMSPILVEHTYLLSADVFNAALIAAGTLALFAARPATAGALLGLALWSRPVTAVLVLPVAAALCWRRFGRRELFRFAVALAIPLLAAALVNTLMYGAPWITSYDRILTVEDRVPRVVSARSLFTNKWPDGIRLMFENREHGLTANAISGLISLLGLLALWRHHRPLTVALAVGTAGFVAVYLPYKYFNARFFFAWQLLLCLPLAVLIADVSGLGLRLGQWTQTALLGSSSPVRRWVSGRSRPVMLAAVGALVACVVVIKILSGRSYHLADHITDAKVFRNDYPCDYFNITHQAWECSRIDRSEHEFPGRSLRPEACRFDGVHRDMLTLAPPAEGGRRRLRFEKLPRAGLTLNFGRQEGSGMGESCLSVAYGGQAPRRVCAQGSGQLQDFQFPAPDPGQPLVLELTIEGSGPQGVCFDGFVR